MEKQRVYFLYNFSNKENALLKIKKLEKNYIVFYFDSSKPNKHWKRVARKEMKKADFVIKYVYKNSIEKENRNLNYELRLAKRYKKSVKSEVCEDWQHLLDSSLNGQQAKQDILLKEYELMLKTTESIEDNRQKISNFYVSIMTTLMAIIASSFALKEFMISCIAMAVLGCFMFILNINWKKSIDHYHDMNYVKFEIIDQLEKKMFLSSFNAEHNLKTAEKLPSFKKREMLLITVFTSITILMIIFGTVLSILFGIHII